MIFQIGPPSISISANGSGMEHGSVCIMPCVVSSASLLAGSQNPALPLSTANRSKPVRFVAMREATTGEKKIWGRKRHLLVDSQGLIIKVKVLGAYITDRDGGKVLLTSLYGQLPRLQLIWADTGYAGKFETWVQETLGVRLEIVKHPWTGIRSVWVPEGQEVDWDKVIPKGFHILPRRWVVERTNAWVTAHRRLSRDFEGTHSSSEAFIYLAMTRIMVSRLARPSPSL